MKKRGVDGHIVNISSMIGHNAEIVKVPMGMYAASKYALTALATELRHEIAIDELNVKITNISPGVVSTDMQRHVFQKLGNAPVNRPMLCASDIADAVLYVLGTPPVVEVNDILISPMHQDKMLDKLSTK
ncbi:farnesol dehydrogenase-like [Augochlora pura]